MGKMIKACHQSTERQNKMMLWALAYGAENRIPTTHLSDSCVNAVNILLQKFLPMEEDITEIKKAHGDYCCQDHTKEHALLP